MLVFFSVTRYLKLEMIESYHHILTKIGFRDGIIDLTNNISSIIDYYCFHSKNNNCNQTLSIGSWKHYICKMCIYIIQYTHIIYIYIDVFTIIYLFPPAAPFYPSFSLRSPSVQAACYEAKEEADRPVLLTPQREYWLPS